MPTITGSGESVLVRARSAVVPLLTVVTAVEVLLAVLESDSVADTVAVLLKLPAAVGVTTRVTVALALLLIVPRGQLTVLVPLQLPWPGVAETKLTPAGKVSVKLTPVAVEGPLLVMVRV